MSLIPIASIESTVGALAGEDRTRVEGLLEEASDLAIEFGKAWTEAGGGTPAPPSVRLIVKRAVLRAFHESPEGYVEERLGEWSGRRDSTSPEESGVFYTASEIETIRKAAGRFGARRGSVRTPSAYGERPDLPPVIYAPVVGFAPGVVASIEVDE